MFIITPQKIRKKSIKLASTLGYPKPPAHLPYCNPIDRTILRNIDDVVLRMCGLHCVIAMSFGLDRIQGLKWIENNHLQSGLTDEEEKFINKKADNALSQKIALRMEALWALCWAINYVKELDFGKYCGDNLASIFPDIEKNEGIEDFAQNAKLRSKEEIMVMEDLAYCLHWGISEEWLSRTETSRYIRDYVIIERRHALSWLLSSARWDDVELDT